MINSIVNSLFYISAFILAMVLVITANHMNKETCGCMRSLLFVKAFSLVCLVMVVFYDIHGYLRIVCIIPIILGMAGWLLLDRRLFRADLIHFIKEIKLLTGFCK